MIASLTRKRHSPIGVDIGRRSVKLVQLSADHSSLVDAVRCELPATGSTASQESSDGESPSDDHLFIATLQQAREGRNFRGRDAVICLNDRQLFLQNIRVPKQDDDALFRSVQQEAAGRIPFPVADTDIRYLEAADIRHGDAVMREIILVACHRPVLDRTLAIVSNAGLRPIAVDIEPAALLRSFSSQFRRAQDMQDRSLLVHIGQASTAVVIAEGDSALFIKYIDFGGQHLDQSVARSLKMQLAEASALRRYNGDRRTDRQDPEIARSVTRAIRPELDRLVAELSKCIRYHSVTFRGQPLARLVLSGGEAAEELLEALSKRLGFKCELSDPFRVYPTPLDCGRHGQWDVATGLALRAIK
ncbi:MAG: hypothetical protein CMJ50_10385 [Planctomycetaceae bacterium]|nr:hypothetical protein [Planctomycetaceae bacterium]